MNKQLPILLIATFYLLRCSPKPEVEIRNITIVEDPETRAFINSWKELSRRFKFLDTSDVKTIALDTIWLRGEQVASSDFYKSHYHGFFSPRLLEIILDTAKTHYSSIGCRSGETIKHGIRLPYDGGSKMYGDSYDCKQAIVDDTIGSVINSYQFTFLHTSKGYKLSGLTSYSHTSSPIETMVDTTAVSKQ